MDNCRHCGDEIHTPDERTGLIHKHGKYSCETINSETGKVKRLKTVAE